MALVFPSNLQGDGDQFLSMFVHKNYRMKRDTIAQKPRLLEIVLPIPNNLIQGTSVSYQQESLGFFGKQAAELSSAFDGGAKSIASVLKQQLTSQNVGEGIKYFGAAIAQEFGSQIPGIGNIIQGGYYGQGITRNPYEVQMFSNVNFRSHSFNYKFVPKSLDEQNTINTIIKKLKYHMLPSYTTLEKTYFKYPDIFELVLNTGRPNDSGDLENYFFKFQPCVLESVNVNYNPEGSPFYHDTGGNGKAPVSLTLDLQFKELLIPEREDIDKIGEISKQTAGTIQIDQGGQEF
jgi:hypothetical protein